MTIGTEGLVVGMALVINGGALLTVLVGVAMDARGRGAVFLEWWRRYGVACLSLSLWALVVAVAWREHEWQVVVPGALVAVCVIAVRAWFDWRRERIVASERSRAAETVLALDPPRDVDAGEARRVESLQARMALLIREGADPGQVERRRGPRRVAHG